MKIKSYKIKDTSIIIHNDNLPKNEDERLANEYEVKRVILKIIDNFKNYNKG